MILGLVVFLGMHLFSTRRDLRAQVIARTGESLYKLGYALVAAVGLALIIWGYAEYRAGGMIHVWTPPLAMKHITIALMLPAVILVVAAFIRGRIYTTLKHPMIVFGSFLAWAVVDRISLKRRTDAGAPPIPVGGPMNDAIAVAVGIVAYLALGFAFHPVVIGVPVFGA
jgi:uncharacterized membrane protein